MSGDSLGSDYAAEYTVSRYLYEDRLTDGVWGAMSGPIRITDMTTSHIINALNMLRRNDPESDYIRLFQIELRKRGVSCESV